MTRRCAGAMWSSCRTGRGCSRARRARRIGSATLRTCATPSWWARRPVVNLRPCPSGPRLLASKSKPRLRSGSRTNRTATRAKRWLIRSPSPGLCRATWGRKGRRWWARNGRRVCDLRQVLGEVLVHLEHGDAVLAEHGLELLIRHDLALVLRVLELVRLDVVPNLAHHLGTGQRVCAHHGGKLFRRLQRLHQGRVDLLTRRALACAGRLGWGVLGRLGLLGWNPFRCCRAALRLAGHGRSPSDGSDTYSQSG